MGVVIFFVLVITMLIVTNAMKRRDGDVPTVGKPKVCPPHKWRWVEIKDNEGNTLMWRIMCDLCGPPKL